MKLRSIEALSYGSLNNVCVDGIGDGLTVVLGPNESGKSSLTSLTRHVLYGFPTPGKLDAYMPANGRRHGKLVFANGQGEWALERTEGPKGGQLAVVNRQGEPMPMLAEDIVGGVTPETFHVVFGFGLDDLSAIASKGNQQIESLLYAADTGLNVSPIKVAEDLKARAEALYAPRASKPAVNRLAAEMKACKARIKALEDESARCAAGEKRAAELAVELQPLKDRRDELDRRVRALETALARVRTSAQKQDSLRQDLDKLTRDIAAFTRDIDLVQVDERVLSQAAVLDGVLEEMPVFRERLEKITNASSAAQDLERRIRTADASLSEVRDTPELRARVQRWIEAKAKLENAAEAGKRDAEQRRIYAEEIAKTPQQEPQKHSVVPGIALLAVGALFAAAGVVLRQSVLFGVAAGFVVAGIFWLVRPRQNQMPTVSAEATRAAAEADTASRVAREAVGALDKARSEWREWLAQEHLDSYGDDPVAVAGLLDEARTRAGLEAERDRLLDQAAREREAAEAWAVRLVDAVSGFDPLGGQLPELSAVLELAARARQALSAARLADTERKKLIAAREGLTGTQKVLLGQMDECSRVITETAGEFSVAVDEAEQTLAALAQVGAENLREAQRECESVADQLATLRGELRQEGRENQLAVEAQKYEGFRARALAEADNHLVHALAARLVNQARERYERERQPQVVKTAKRVYSEMTDGRYLEIRMPWDGNGGITVAGADRNERAISALSTGAAQQLYLALRVGTIAAHGDRGKWLPVLMDDVVVNFDPERREGAVRAIAELAALRQVVFFTCHPDTAALLMREVPGAKQVELDRCPLV